MATPTCINEITLEQALGLVLSARLLLVTKSQDQHHQQIQRKNCLNEEQEAALL